MVDQIIKSFDADTDIIHLVGSIDGGVFLSYLAHCSQEANHDWFVNTQKTCQRDIGLKRARREVLCNDWCQRGWLAMKRAGVHGLTHFRLDMPRITQQIARMKAAQLSTHQNNR